ncbi:hypothetical protein ATANTOWER_016650 [Ataeniobius toweri]|uniref:Uncharacterized protein n=1 Tax=Ataeniobius toweri TaxID=208326 RepID=A0ABU7BT73_9TELE|nr:hypothetical protein [Ataeniobius toweri]
MFCPEQQGKVFITCTACTLTQAGACVVSTVGNKVRMRLLCATHMHTHPHPSIHTHDLQDVFYEGKLVHTMYLLKIKQALYYFCLTIISHSLPFTVGACRDKPTYRDQCSPITNTL